MFLFYCNTALVPRSAASRYGAAVGDGPIYLELSVLEVQLDVRAAGQPTDDVPDEVLLPLVPLGRRSGGRIWCQTIEDLQGMSSLNSSVDIAIGKCTKRWGGWVRNVNNVNIASISLSNNHLENSFVSHITELVCFCCAERTRLFMLLARKTKRCASLTYLFIFASRRD